MLKRPHLWIAGGALAAVVLAALAWYLGSPLFIDRSVEEPFPTSLPAPGTTEQTAGPEYLAGATEAMATAAAEPDHKMDEPMPDDPDSSQLRSGTFQGADAFHQGSGLVAIHMLADGNQILRLQDFMVTNGPDLHVLLASGRMPMSSNELGDYVDLGSLKGNIGNQNYELPPGIDLDRYRSVVIYCLPFHVVFATASLN